MAKALRAYNHIDEDILDILRIDKGESVPFKGALDFSNLGWILKPISYDRGLIKKQSWYSFEMIEGDNVGDYGEELLREDWDHVIHVGKIMPRSRTITLGFLNVNGEVQSPWEAHDIFDGRSRKVHKARKSQNLTNIEGAIESYFTAGMGGSNQSGELQAYILISRITLTLPGNIVFDYQRLNSDYINNFEANLIKSINNIDLTEDVKLNSSIYNNVKALMGKTAPGPDPEVDAIIDGNNSLLSSPILIDHADPIHIENELFFQDGFTGNFKQFIINELTLPKG